MKYKRQLMSGIFALALLAGTQSAFAAGIPSTGSKMVEQTNQAKMKSISSKGAIGGVAKKITTLKHKKVTKTHKVKTTNPTTTTSNKPLR